MAKTDLPTGLEEFRAEASAWIDANRHLAPSDYGAIIPIELVDEGKAWQRHMHEAGYAGIHWDVEHGGRGLTPEHHRVFADLCQEANIPSTFNLVGLTLSAGAIRLFGTDEQKRTHLPPMLTAERIWCQLFSEPGAGSDLAGLTTRAELDGDEWVVNGQKVWTSTGTHSDWAILMARSEPDEPKHRGISFFVVDMKSPGIDARPLYNMAGTAEFAEVFMTDVRLPADSLIGERGQGWQVAMDVLAHERSAGTGAVRTIERRIDTMVSRVVATEPHAVMRDQLMQRWIDGAALVAMASQSASAGPRSSLGKLALSNYRYEVAELIVNAEGAEGMLASGSTRALNTTPGSWFAGGTLQVQRNIIGERVLGLAKEPKTSG